MNLIKDFNINNKELLDVIADNNSSNATTSIVMTIYSNKKNQCAKILAPNINKAKLFVTIIEKYIDLIIHDNNLLFNDISEQVELFFIKNIGANSEKIKIMYNYFVELLHHPSYQLISFTQLLLDFNWFEIKNETRYHLKRQEVGIFNDIQISKYNRNTLYINETHLDLLFGLKNDHKTHNKANIIKSLINDTHQFKLAQEKNMMCIHPISSINFELSKQIPIKNPFPIDMSYMHNMYDTDTAQYSHDILCDQLPIPHYVQDIFILKCNNVMVGYAVDYNMIKLMLEELLFQYLKVVNNYIYTNDIKTIQDVTQYIDKIITIMNKVKNTYDYQILDLYNDNSVTSLNRLIQSSMKDLEKPTSIPDDLEEIINLLEIDIEHKFLN